MVALCRLQKVSRRTIVELERPFACCSPFAVEGGWVKVGLCDDRSNKSQLFFGWASFVHMHSACAVSNRVSFKNMIDPVWQVIKFPLRPIPVSVKYRTFQGEIGLYFFNQTIKIIFHWSIEAIVLFILSRNYAVNHLGVVLHTGLGHSHD